ncbi:DUF3347 domain-containing protein [Olivibacter sp. SDN3]|uniref:DUF3347 domain-containing protein n=1 Tax=Olivibacter sp. SDN3 TaxID=2764720 RepID=UPI00165187AE|nr:DUF3347 domain-containing protein [Olivibacter sp. SDN3]QNL48863.1 DUF3347 domain-containing protein [Olivibacter sp. SDN3]
MKKWNLLVLLSLFICSCNSGGSTDDKADTAAVSAEGVIIENDTLSTVFAAYISLKDALVDSDPNEASHAANTLAESLNTIHGCENTAMLAQELANTKDLGIQRTAFSTISEDVIAMYKNTSLNAGTIYVIHCPMYNNNEGANWLSVSPEVENPYFGDEMLTCGTVTEEIN